MAAAQDDSGILVLYSSINEKMNENRFSDALICFRFDRRKMEELLHKNQLSEERKEAEEKEEAIVR